MARQHNFVIVASSRWETEWIAEWLIYHRAIGFDHAYLYCNDDDPVDFYNAVLPFCQGSDPFVTFHHHGIQGQQEQMFLHFMRNHVRNCEWFAFIDIDEFILLRHANTIDVFIDTLPMAADSIHFNSVNAGYNGYVERPRGLAIKLFNRRANWADAFTKCVTRTSAYDPSRIEAAFAGVWWHNISAIVKPGSKVINVLGMDMTDFYLDVHKSWAQFNTAEFHERLIDTACLYHIGMKSEGDMLRRLQRGVGGEQSCQEVWQSIIDAGPEAVRAFLRPFHEVEETRLVEVWSSLEDKAYVGQIAAPPPGENLARDCECMQSSTSIHSVFPESVARDAGNVVNGKPTGRHHHCTEIEMDPWWQVKLKKPTSIREIRIFNRVDGARDRLRNFILKGSLDGLSWEVIFEKRDDISFGGVDGRFFCWQPQSAQTIAYMRFCGIGQCLLDLDQVEVF